MNAFCYKRILFLNFALNIKYNLAKIKTYDR